MPLVPDRSTFESAYASQAPWDIGKPQKALIDVADRITGSTTTNSGATSRGWRPS